MQAGTAALLALAPAGAALANEFDLLNEPRPTSNYVIDDANVLNKTSKKELNYNLAQLEVTSAGTGGSVVRGRACVEVPWLPTKHCR